MCLPTRSGGWYRTQGATLLRVSDQSRASVVAERPPGGAAFSRSRDPTASALARAGFRVIRSFQPSRGLAGWPAGPSRGRNRGSGRGHPGGGVGRGARPATRPGAGPSCRRWPPGGPDAGVSWRADDTVTRRILSRIAARMGRNWSERCLDAGTPGKLRRPGKKGAFQVSTRKSRGAVPPRPGEGSDRRPVGEGPDDAVVRSKQGPGAILRHKMRGDPVAEERRRIIGQRIQTLRTAKRWTQRRLADRVGCSEQLISRLERGETAGYFHLLDEVAGALGLPPGAILPQTPLARTRGRVATEEAPPFANPGRARGATG
jgi:DNA-binding XRE family transcriptional regulator